MEKARAFYFYFVNFL